MKKIIMVLTLLALSVATFSCGGGSGSSSSPHGENPGLPSVVQLRSSHNVAQTNATVYLHARILDGNGVPVKNERVTFTNLSEPFGVIKSVLRVLGLRKPVGALSATVVKTDNLGIATAKLTSTTSGFATIQAEVNGGAGQVRDKRTIFFGEISGPVAAPSPTMSLHVDDGNGTFDQEDDFNLFKSSSATDNQRTIKAVVKDGSGSPLANVDVTFGSDSPDEITFDKTSPVKTNTSGEAFVNITVKPAILSDLQRVLNITAQATADSTSLADIVSLYIKDPVTATSITISADPDAVAPGETSTILAAVKMLGSLPVPDDSAVSFETIICGSVTPFAQTTGGVATATFTAPSIPPAGGVCQVKASIGSATPKIVDIKITTELMVQPEEQTINGVNGGKATFTIFGGVAPYTVTSTNRFIACNDTNSDGDCSDAVEDLGTWNVALSSNQFFTVTVPASSPAGDITLTVRDSAGSTVTATLAIGGGTALSILPNAVTVFRPSASPNQLDFTIFGGLPPYSTPVLNINNPSMFSVAPTGSNTFRVTVEASATTETLIVTVRDNAGTTTTATITISSPTAQALAVIPASRTISNPSNVAPNNTAAFDIVGGTGGYKAFSNAPALATVPSGVLPGPSVTATLQSAVTSLTADTTVTITIYDSAGSSTTASLILDVGPTSPLNVLPGTVSVTGLPAGDTGDNVKFFISGGSGDYISVVSSNNTVIDNPSIVLGNQFTIDPVVVAASTSVTLTVSDSVGATKTTTVTVTPATSSLAINPSSITVDQSVGNFTFTIIGGFPSYDLFTSDISIVTVEGGPKKLDWPSTTFTANVVGEGDATITVVDSDGQTVTADVTVTAPPTSTPPPVPQLTVLPPSASVSCTAGGARIFVVAGGVPSYNVTSSNPNVSISGTIPIPASGGAFTATVAAASCGLFPDASTTVPIIVTDTASTTATTTLTVTNP